MLCYGYSHVLELSTAGTIRVRTRPKISFCPNLFFFSRICDICGNGKSTILFVFTNFFPQ